MGTGWKNDDKNKSVAIDVNTKTPRQGHPGEEGHPNMDAFNTGRAAPSVRVGRDSVTVTTNRKK